MWIPAGVVYLLVALALGAAWLRASEQQMCRQATRGLVQGAWLGLLVALLIGLSSCKQEVERTAAAMTGGEPGIGKQVIQQYGCGSCHTIPGIPGANALVGPSLEHIASRMYIAGVLTNTPEHMLRWLQDPPAVDPLTAMPNLGVTEADARDMAGYLYTLR
jgi:cytochrome c2